MEPHPYGNLNRSNSLMASGDFIGNFGGQQRVQEKPPNPGFKPQQPGWKPYHFYAKSMQSNDSMAYTSHDFGNNMGNNFIFNPNLTSSNCFNNDFAVHGMYNVKSQDLQNMSVGPEQAKNPFQASFAKCSIDGTVAQPVNLNVMSGSLNMQNSQMPQSKFLLI